MNASKFLSKAIGIYLVIISIAMIVKQQQFVAAINNLLNDQALMFVTGFVTLILGILMVVSHNIWQWNWRILITLVGWITFLKAVSILFYPQFINHTSELFFQNTTYAYFAGGIDLILGMVLCYFGFRK